MTRKEYIDILTQRLGGLDEAYCADIILEIEDHIDGLVREHPEKSPEEIIEGLEPPESLADSLREAAGLGPYEPPHAEQPKSGQKAKKNVHITIDDIELEEAIRKAFDIARIFRRNRDGTFKESQESQTSEDVHGNYEFGDSDLASVHEVSVRCRSSDIRVLVADTSLAVRTPGEEHPRLELRYDSTRGTFGISTAHSKSEPDLIELRIPSTVDSLLVSTISGDVQVLDRIGSLSIKTASGDVDVAACAGDIEVRTASGDVSLAQCQENITVTTASGSVSIEADELCNAIEVSSASGDVLLYYPELWDARVAVSTISGDIEHNGNATDRGTIVFGSGLAPVRITTVSGDISVRQMR